MSSSSGCLVPPVLSWASFYFFTELVKKIGTSPSPSLVDARQRKARSKKMTRVLMETDRYAKGLALRPVCITLTYRSDDDYSSKHISTFFDKLRRWSKKQGHPLPYVWVLERAGRLHYHIVIWMPKGAKLDMAKLERWWPWGSTWVEACRSIKGWGKYMAKFHAPSKPLPKNARVLGYGGIDASVRQRIARAGWPRWLQAIVPISDHAKRLKGAGWVNLDTGEVYVSPYVWRAGRIVLKSSCTPTPV